MTLLDARSKGFPFNLRVREVDSDPDVMGVNTIVVSNGTLTDDGGGQVTITISGGGGTPGGVDGDIQYNNAGAFGGFGDWDGSTLTISGNITVPGGANTELFGNGAIGSGLNSLAVGNSATTSTYNNATVLGYNASVSAAESVAIGSGASAAGGGIGIGFGVSALGNAVVIGKNASAALSGLSIGIGATDNGFANCIVIGTFASSNQSGNVVIGGSATANVNRDNVTIGYLSSVTGVEGVSIGKSTTASNFAVALGKSASAGFTSSIAIGWGATTTKLNQMIIGSSNVPMNEIKPIIKTNLTNTVQDILVLSHTTTGLPAVGLGLGILFQLESDTTPDQDAASIDTVWSVETHGSRSADLVFSTVDNAAAISEKLRLKSAGILKFSGTMGAGSDDPTTDAPSDWVEVDISGTTYYLPAYN